VGPHKGEVYKGNEVPVPQSIGTAIQKKEGIEGVALNYAGALSATRAGSTAIGKFNAENNTNLTIPQYGPNRGKMVDLNNGGQVVTPDASGNFSPVRNTASTGGEQTAAQWAQDNGIPVSNNGGTRTTQQQQQQMAQWYANGQKGPKPAEPGHSAHETGNAIDVPLNGRTPENRAKLEAAGFKNTVPNEPWHFERVGGQTTNAPAAQGPQVPQFREPGHEQESVGTFNARKKAAEKANEKIATATAEQVANAGSIADTIGKAQEAINVLDSGKHNIGTEVGGTLHGRGPLFQAVGGQFETEAARNTKSVMDTVRAIGGAAAQGPIKGHLTNQELTFMTENKPTATSDPAYTKMWLEKSIRTMQRAQGQAEAQARSGGLATNPVTTPTKTATKRYNPQTKQFEDIK
jgi:hypothetical protein